MPPLTTPAQLMLEQLREDSQAHSVGWRHHAASLERGQGRSAVSITVVSRGQTPSEDGRASVDRSMVVEGSMVAADSTAVEVEGSSHSSSRLLLIRRTKSCSTVRMKGHFFDSSSRQQLASGRFCWL